MQIYNKLPIGKFGYYETLCKCLIDGYRNVALDNRTSTTRSTKNVSLLNYKKLRYQSKIWYNGIDKNPSGYNLLSRGNFSTREENKVQNIFKPYFQNKFKT